MHRRSISPCLVSIALAAGCRSAPVGTQDAPLELHVLGHSVEERAIECVRRADEGAPVLFIAGIHGNEAAGVPLVRRLARELEAGPEWSARRHVLIVPEANPDGLAHGTRSNARGVDLNRNFPAANWGSDRQRGAEPLSEPESRALHDLILAERPACILSFHQPVDVIDYDGPAEELARALAEVGPLAVRRLGGRPGSLGSWAGLDLGIPILTIELPRWADALDGDELWALYGPMLRRAITWQATASALDPAALLAQ